MRKNRMGFLGLLGFLGFLGFIPGNYGFYGFFGFFGFLSSFWGRGSDERVDRNANRACRNAFIFVLVASSSFISYMALLQLVEAFQLAFSVLFAGSLIVYVLSFIFYDRRGE